MEKIKVNMNPNPLDVQTIHASQNDGEARQWGFELHNNGDVIGSSEVTDQITFKAYEGGTEEILPTNGSTPTTSPFLGDIRYPQGLLTDQEFLYRESPTEEDGLAKITDIKGNTLVWNQLFEPRDNGSFSFNGVTVTVQDGKYTLSGTATSSGGRWARWTKSNIVFKKGHKYLYSIFVAMIYSYSSSGDFAGELSAGQRIFEPTEDMTVFLGFNATNGTTYNQSGYIYIIDLTAMGLDISSPSDFTSLFPLSYYSYNQGSLLSFNGNGIKTTGKNQFGEIQVGMRPDPNTGAITPASNTNWVSKKIFTNGKINALALSSNGYTGSINIAEYDANGNYIQNTNFFYGTNISGNYRASKTLNANTAYVIPNGYQTGGASAITGAEIEFSTYDIETFEPYTSSTLSLPISTYFPNGMDGVGTDYDELTNTKATTRMTRVDLGTLPWIYHSQSGNFYADNAITNRKVPLGLNAKCPIYQQVDEDTISGVSSLELDKSFAFQTNMPKRIIVRDTSYNDATAFKTAMSGVYLVYPLATPTETSFTTASLVTENGEIPLSNEDGVLIGKCTEQLSENPGFIDAKIKLSDADGECYSNKIQLHIERSPQ